MNKLLIAYIGTLLMSLIIIFICIYTITTIDKDDVMWGAGTICLQFFFCTQWIKWIYEEAFKETN